MNHCAPSPAASPPALLLSAASTGDRRRQRELDLLAAQVPAREILAGQPVLRRGEVIEKVCVIRSGRVGVMREIGGRRVILIVLRAGDVIGETALLLHGRARWDTVALVDTTVLEIPAGLVLPGVKEESSLALQWIIGTVNRLVRAWGRLEELLARDLHSQVASLLLHELEGEADVFLTQQAMADMLGARRTSVTPVLGDLQRERLIAVGYGRVTLLNREGLAALASAGLGRLDRREAVTRSRTRGAAA